MDIEKLIKGIEEHKDGITLDWDGNTPDLNGFMVSITNNKPTSTHKGELRRAIQKLNTARRMLGMDNALIGSWVDKSGMVFIDLSLNVPDYLTASAIGRTFKQQAVFNLNNFTTIEL